YGCSLNVGIGVPIPILNEEIALFTSVADEEIFAPIVDYGLDYPQGGGAPLGYVSYAQLKTGEMEFDGQKVSTSPLASYSTALEIANILKEWIESGKFLLGEPQDTLPSVHFAGFDALK
ncbi:MAG: homocysteine biosynthesis protein, partial [Desulfomonilaceae bacterium]